MLVRVWSVVCAAKHEGRRRAAALVLGSMVLGRRHVEQVGGLSGTNTTATVSVRIGRWDASVRTLQATFWRRALGVAREALDHWRLDIPERERSSE